jgi:hypothetical protein
MLKKDIANRVVQAARSKGGNIFLTDISESDKNVALSERWIVPVGIGHFTLTDAGLRAAE